MNKTKTNKTPKSKNYCFSALSIFLEPAIFRICSESAFHCLPAYIIFEYLRLCFVKFCILLTFGI